MIFLRNVNRTILAYMLQANMGAEEGGSSVRRYAAKIQRYQQQLINLGEVRQSSI